ncbi:hypothetical protein NDR87_08105 [Nocardia sp. CDC159]|uniref:Uncharacterized protein n=1 Tax=Nocardia pulmonis TaxID=2951408 RepID=A0A9X2E5G3_9NOCA|nr:MULTISPECIES: hypothetical protein [Nocardia]MCM6773433.1 hypothetical protein [Nocardia pulmonis]MCM6786320.1 hypothetical protein [Nocardia sp. CDC159]
MADPRANSRAPHPNPVITGPCGRSACAEPVPTHVERFGFGGEDEPPSRGRTA